jgi:N-terminal glycosyl-hydrolase-114-associated domain
MSNDDSMFLTSNRVDAPTRKRTNLMVNYLGNKFKDLAWQFDIESNGQWIKIGDNSASAGWDTWTYVE